MKRLLFLIPFILAALLIAGCQKPAEAPKVVLCEPPYMQFDGGCCLDQNSNSVCDNNETVQQPKNLTPEPKSKPVLANQKPEEVKNCNIRYAINWAPATNACQMNGTRIKAILMYSGKGNGIDGMWFYATTENGTERYIKDDVGFAKAEARNYTINLQEPLTKLIAMPMIIEDGVEKACLNQRMIVVGSGLCAVR